MGATPAAARERARGAEERAIARRDIILAVVSVVKLVNCIETKMWV